MPVPDILIVWYRTRALATSTLSFNEEIRDAHRLTTVSGDNLDKASSVGSETDLCNSVIYIRGVGGGICLSGNKRGECA